MESANIESRIYKEKREEIYEKRRRIIDSTAFYSGMISILKSSQFLVSTRFSNTIFMIIANLFIKLYAIFSFQNNKENNVAPQGFWARSMLFCDTLKGIIQEHDIPILEFLQDIKISHMKP